MTSTTTGHVHTEAFDDGYLQVSPLHKIYYHQYGKADGKPVMFLHGGPGSQTSIANTVFFDPSVYRVVLLDQRGSGKSRPIAEIKENTTQLLVQDVETLREKLGIKKWHMVFGGSWGSTLALAYAETHPRVVGSLVLRGIFLGEKQEVAKSTSGSLSGQLRPQEYEEFLSYLPEEKRGDPLQAFHEMFVGEDRVKAEEAARVWVKWEKSTSTLLLDEDALAKLDEDNYSIRFATMETHYFVNGAFLEDQQLCKNAYKLKGIPVSIVQGRYDIVCAPDSAWRLHKALPESKLYWIPDAGHSSTEPSTFKKLVEICDEYAKSDLHL
ncbi:prolyl aminopeptidase [Pleomassaria siparia CBS 279.74]|uniref:Proline iminopeptidase n=1 Tax=Pleomassaria siparia CBS 279.74 TaxID=1314801 RepID=A0A6G1KGC4_9PLEO|nr:prolyl aminopeptidase [Pleomassaria siparia CBS 279.74]